MRRRHAGPAAVHDHAVHPRHQAQRGRPGPDLGHRRTPRRVGRQPWAPSGSWPPSRTARSRTCCGRQSSVRGRPAGNGCRATREKAAREAGNSTTWTDPNEDFEAAVTAAVDAVFDDARVAAALDGLRGHASMRFAASNSLSAKLVQLTMPGVPDVYQGTEFWERSLTDPDNRRPVDFATPRSGAGQASTPGRCLTRARRPASSWSPPGHSGCGGTGPSCSPGYSPVTAAGAAAGHLRGLLPWRGCGRRTHPGHPAPRGTGSRRRLARHRRRTFPCRCGTNSPVPSMGPAPSRWPNCWAPTRWPCWYRRMEQPMTLVHNGSARFDVWAPDASTVVLRGGRPGVPHGETGHSAPGAEGWWSAPDAPSRRRGGLRLPARRRHHPLPDPRSRRVPDGVHALSRTFDPAAHHVAGLRLAGQGTQRLGDLRTPRGHLHAGGNPGCRRRQSSDYLADLGVDFVELLPVNGFNGTHNWGYDGVQWYAVHEGYGGPAAYQRFVDAAHAAGLGRHPGRGLQPPRPQRQLPAQVRPVPEAGRRQHLGRLRQPRRPGSDVVREYILDNAALWLRDYHVDGLRLDAVHALRDERAVHILEEFGALGDAVAAETGLPKTLIAESDLNNPRLIYPRDANGYGLAGQWSDDFHHAVHVNVSGETTGLLRGLRVPGRPGQGPQGRLPARRQLLQLPRPAPRQAHQRLAGAPGGAGGLQPEPRPDRQPGHRATGSPQSLSYGQLAVGRGAHADLAVHAHAVHGRGIRRHHAVAVLHLPPGTRARQGHRGRAGSRNSNAWGGIPPSCPIPQDPETFRRSKLDWDEAGTGDHARLLELYRSLTALRRESSGTGRARLRRDRGGVRRRRRLAAVPPRQRRGAAELRRREGPAGRRQRLRPAGHRRRDRAGDGDALALAPWSAAIVKS